MIWIIVSILVNAMALFDTRFAIISLAVSVYGIFKQGKVI
jgi:hypothetical protein